MQEPTQADPLEFHAVDDVLELAAAMAEEPTNYVADVVKRNLAQMMAATCREALVENAHHFTCSEANAMEAFLAVWADENTAADFAESHAEGDEPGDAHYEGDHTTVEIDGVVVAETRKIQL